MTIDPNILLAQLQPVVRPAYADGPGSAPSAPLEQQPFDELLARAARGLIDSGRPVTADSAIAEPFTNDQLARLATAADQAEASGARRALLLMDGRGLVLDVPSRAVTMELGTGASSTVSGIDAAVHVAPDTSDAPPRPLQPPTGIAPPALGRQLDAASQRPSTAA